MKLRFPKEITVNDQTFKIKYDANAFDGEFAYADKKNPAFIRIGTGDLKHSPLPTLMRITHELKEIIHIGQSTRFRRIDNNEYEFHYTHREHTDMCERLVGALNNFII